MKKLLTIAILAGLALGVGAQVTKTILNQRVKLTLKAGDTITVTVSSQKVAVLVYKVPAGKSLKGSIALAGELK